MRINIFFCSSLAVENKKKKNEAGPVIEPLAGENVDEPLDEPVNHKKTKQPEWGDIRLFHEVQLRKKQNKNGVKTGKTGWDYAHIAILHLCF